MIKKCLKIYLIHIEAGQPEAWFLGKKCIIMRSETEWIEQMNNNNNILYDYKTPIKYFYRIILKSKNRIY